MTKTLFSILITTLLLFSSSTFAQQNTQNKLNTLELSDQHDKSIKLDSSVKWLIFSHHKDGGEWTMESLSELKIKNLKAKNWLFISDIAKMPGLITRLFAIPKMQEYPFSIGLIRDEGLTQTWPQKADQVSIYELNNLAIIKSHFFKSKEDLLNFLRQLP